MLFKIVLIYAFPVFLLALELILGFAYMGGIGNPLVVEREKNPRQFWFVICFQILLVVLLSVVYWTMVGGQ